MKSFKLFVFLIFSMICLCNCSQNLVRVQPYDRGNLSQLGMSDELHTLITTMTEHGYFSREGSFGGGLIGGGGCGCN